MSPAIRDIILKTQRIYLDMQSHVVVDHYHVIQCFKCQGVGHKSDSKFCPLYRLTAIAQYACTVQKSTSPKHAPLKSTRHYMNVLIVSQVKF